MEVGNGKKNYISEGNQDFVSENRSIWKLKIKTTSSTKILISPLRNKLASNVFFLFWKLRAFFDFLPLYLGGKKIFHREKFAFFLGRDS